MRGSFDNGRGVELGVILDAAFDRSLYSIVLDAAELEFIEAAGSLAVSNAEKRLAKLGAKLALRSPSALAAAWHSAGTGERGHWWTAPPDQLQFVPAVSGDARASTPDDQEPTNIHRRGYCRLPWGESPVGGTTSS